MQRRTAARIRPHVEKLLRDHHGLLVSLGAQFDGGVPTMALPLAVSIRVLAHDTGASHSLLGQLGLKDSIQYVDTATPIDPANLLPTAGLVMMRTTNDGQGHLVADWVPPLDDGPPTRQGKVVSFVTWWDTPVVKDVKETLWSRRKLVLAVANQEGGAHVDPDRNEALRQFEEENGFGWMIVDANGRRPMDHQPLLPCVRQIAHELQRSIERGMADILSPPVG